MIWLGLYHSIGPGSSTRVVRKPSQSPQLRLLLLKYFPIIHTHKVSCHSFESLIPYQKRHYEDIIELLLLLNVFRWAKLLVSLWHKLLNAPRSSNRCVFEHIGRPCRGAQNLHKTHFTEDIDCPEMLSCLQMKSSKVCLHKKQCGSHVSRDYLSFKKSHSVIISGQCRYQIYPKYSSRPEQTV